MSGEDMQEELNYLDKFFYEEFVPHYGRYINEAATADANGVTYVPPPVHNPYQKWFVVGAAAVAAIITISMLKKRKKL